MRQLGEEPPRRRGALPRRRAALGVAFVLLAAAALGAGLALRGGGEPTAGDDAAAPGPSDLPNAGVAEAGEVSPPTEADLTPQSRFKAEFAPGAATLSDRASSLAPPTRATDVDLWVELRLADADELSDAAGGAMAITRDLGGWVAGSDVDTEGREGRAELALRIPVGRVEDAVVRLSELGTITGQRVETRDLQTGIDARDRRIERLERSIRLLELRLESGTLGPEEKLRVQLELERKRNAVADLRRENLRDRREAATSELTLLLHTREAPGPQEDDEGGAAGAARDALDVLGTAGAIALFLGIVLSPVLLLAVLLWLALRARSRRVETRLLERPGQAAPPSAPHA